jgi:two-component system NtrC family response regulator
MQEALHLCLKAAKANLHVLVCGETGTGKELAARRIHEASDRARGPFVAVNCAALAESLLESELFGHVKGAFTGAIHDRRGKFVAASGGTIFLDEVGEMGLSSQAKLLRVLEEKKVTPVGSEKAVNCDARIIAATNQNLRERVEQGKFRDDLYYRLCGIEITMPPLRDRVEDIPLLALHFLHKATAGRLKELLSGRPLCLAEEALQMLVSFNWPGNVRQLEQALLAAAAICEGEEIGPANFPGWLRNAVESGPAAPAPTSSPNHAVTTEPALSEREARWRAERARYLKALEVTKYPSTGRWNIHAAARELGLPRKTLTYRLKKLHLLKWE